MAMIRVFNTAHPNGVDVPDPSELQYSLHDISASDAGRDTNLKMYKGRKGQKVEYQVAWNYPTAAETATILQAFDDEYFEATIWDPKQGQNVRREYYRSDPAAPVQMWLDKATRKMYSKVSFTLIER